MLSFDKCPICETKNISIFSNFEFSSFHLPKEFVLYKCNNCGFLFKNPRYTEDELYNLYNDNYYFFNRKNEKEFKRIEEQLIRIFSMSQDLVGGKILEIGSAKGYALKILEKLGYSVLGIEISEYASAFSKNILKLNVFNGTLETFVKSGHDKFPIIFALDLIEHIANPKEFFKNLNNILELNGTLVLDTPNARSQNIPILRKKWEGFNPFHISLFSKDNLTILLEQNGFKIERIASYSNFKKSGLNYYLFIIKSFVKDILIYINFYKYYQKFQSTKIDNANNTSFNFETLISSICEKIKNSKMIQEKTKFDDKCIGDNILIISKKIK